MFHQCAVSGCRITIIFPERIYEELDGGKAIQNVDLLLKNFFCEYDVYLCRLSLVAFNFFCRIHLSDLNHGLCMN